MRGWGGLRAEVDRAKRGDVCLRPAALPVRGACGCPAHLVLAQERASQGEGGQRGGVPEKRESISSGRQLFNSCSHWRARCVPGRLPIGWLACEKVETPPAHAEKREKVEIPPETRDSMLCIAAAHRVTRGRSD